MSNPEPVAPRTLYEKDRGYREGRATVLREMYADIGEQLDVAERILAELDGPLPTADEVRGILADPPIEAEARGTEPGLDEDEEAIRERIKGWLGPHIRG